MPKKFIEGLIFGSGFAIALVAILYLVAHFALPVRIDSHVDSYIDPHIDIENKTVNDTMNQTAEFHELSVDERISLATVVAVARYEPGEDGAMRAVITEILKKETDTEFYYDIGQEFSWANRYARDKKSYGDGVVVFFTGSPAMMKSSMTFSGDRVRALGDMPLDLLRDKCRSPDA